ncbi:MAG: cysteine--tRNA ligase [Planctomycetes bacterium]|nr:cysteine--tRNA ligase [Planctomycetota bacterium]
MIAIPSMSFQIHNTLSRRKEEFRSLQPGIVRMYNCGPTVYSRAHIGNMRTFLLADLLRRWLELSGYEVRQVMNITDVGHLTDDDAGEGEDKIEAQARREKRDPWEISRGYTELFLSDLAKLSFVPPLVHPRASEHVPEMLEMIEGLIAKGHAYRVGDDVYFDVKSFPRYGALSGNRVAELEAGARIAVREEKRNPEDFALWKSDPAHLMKWKSVFGEHGFPGWHIECSAMSRKHLGEQLDIHTGGEDNIFPHHECEIAQSEAFTGKTFARYWMHARFLQVDGGKMSKRLGNCYSLDDVVAKGYEPRHLRYCLIRGHYRQPLNFTWGILEECRSALESLDDFVRRLRVAAAAGGPARGEELVAAARASFDAAMDDDLNTPSALAAVFALRGATLEDRLGPQAAHAALGFLERVHAALGVLRLEQQNLDQQVEGLIRARLAARKAKDFAAADRLRGELVALGIALEDTPRGVLWKRADGTGGGPIQ